MASTITDGRIKHNFVFLTQGTFFDKTVLLLETLFLFFSKEATLHEQTLYVLVLKINLLF